MTLFRRLALCLFIVGCLTVMLIGCRANKTDTLSITPIPASSLPTSPIGDPMPGESVIVSAKPRFIQHDEFIYLAIGDANRSYEIGWGMSSNIVFIPVSLDTNRIYTFTVTGEPYRSITIPELKRVQLDGQTIYDIEVCEVHKTKMELEEVHIAYGLLISGTNEPSGKIEQQLFPHYREYTVGGCVISPDSPKTEKIYVCAECKKAYEDWKKNPSRQIN